MKPVSAINENTMNSSIKQIFSSNKNISRDKKQSQKCYYLNGSPYYALNKERYCVFMNSHRIGYCNSCNFTAKEEPNCTA